MSYEQAFADRVGARFAIAFGFARHALTSLLEGAGLKPGDAVILSPLTCKVVPLALLSLDLRPVYADLDTRTLNLDPAAVEAAIGPGARAILFQHTYGSPGGRAEVASIAAAHDLVLVEDCAQALPCANAADGPTGAAGGRIYSANLLKPLPAGSGGVAVTDDPVLADRVAESRDRLRSPGPLETARLRLEVWVHDHLFGPAVYWPLFELNRRLSPAHRARPLDAEIASEIGATARRVSAYQAQRGLAWLERVDELAEHSLRCCRDYADRLRDAPALELPIPAPTRPLYCFPVLLSNKQRALVRARRARVELVAWPIQTPIYPIVDEARLAAYGYRAGSCPAAEDVARRLVGLPTHRKIALRHREHLAELLRRNGGV